MLCVISSPGALVIRDGELTLIAGREVVCDGIVCLSKATVSPLTG